MKKLFFIPVFLLLCVNGFAGIPSFPITNYEPRMSLASATVLVFPEDDLSFKNSSFNDSRWTPVKFGANLLDLFSSNTTAAWYRLHIRFPAALPERQLSVFLGEIYDRDEVYFNGKKIGSRGTMDGPVRHAYEWDRFYSIPTPLIEPGRDNVLAIRVKGPFDRKLGIMNPSPYMMPTEDIIRNYFTDGFRDLLFIIVYFVICGYFLLFFIRRPKEKDHLFFALYTFSLAVYSFLRTEFRYLVSDDFYIMKKIEYMVLYMTAALFPAFIYSFFRKRSPLVIKLFYILMICGILVIAFTNSPQFWSIFNLYAQYVFFGAFLFPFILMFGQLKKNKDAKYLLFSFLLLLIAAIHDALISRDLLHTPLLMSYLFFAVIVCQALILANRFVRINKEVEDLNVNLERKVDDRTKELNMANRELRRKQDIIDDEMKMAERVQVTMVPRGTNLPVVKGLEFGTLFKPMEIIGGDIYDIIRIDHTHYGFLIADVSGHGVPSALVTAMLKTTYAYNAKPGRKISDITRSVNEEMFKLIGDVEQYFTAFFGIMDLENRIFSFSNTGHHPVLMYRPATGEVTALTTEGIIGGKFTNVDFKQDEQPFDTGDSFLFYTDGILEAMNADEEHYGNQRLKDFMRIQRHLKADEFVQALYTDLEIYCEGAPADDDRTLLYVKVI